MRSESVKGAARTPVCFAMRTQMTATALWAARIRRFIVNEKPETMYCRRGRAGWGQSGSPGRVFGS